MDLLSLKDIAGGALQEKANAAMERVLDNMQDPNTPWKNKRQINIKIAFSQNEERDDASVEVSVDMKLAPVSPVVTRMAIGKDLHSGKNYVEEYGKQIKGQMSIELEQLSGSIQQTRGGLAGASTEGKMEPNNKVVDLRKAAL